MSDDRYTIPGLAGDTASAVTGILERRLVAFVDLALTLKHVHWNVVGPGFIAVHEMLDPQVDAVREMVDEIAERIAALGGSPRGTPGSVVEGRDGDDYALARATVPDHLAALDGRYAAVIEETRAAQRPLGDLDPVSEDMVIGHLRDLEQFQWFVRAHLENAAGELRTVSADAP
jgi:starvation-inducible DNA-binding protein